MKTILVPTDFSKASESAAQYGASLAHKVSSKLELVHVINTVDSDKKRVNWKKLEAEMIRSAEEGAKKLIATIRKEVNPTFSCLSGFPFQQVISDYAEQSNADLIVIGSRGASGVKKALFGSNAATLVDGSPKPVIVVPDGATFNGINKIVYATDLAHLDEEVKTIVSLAKSLNSEIVILHVIDKPDGKREIVGQANTLSKITDYKKLRFEIVENKDVVKGIEEFIAKEQPDLLAMFTHELGFAEKLLGRGLTRKVAFQNTLPLLAINRTLLKG